MSVWRGALAGTACVLGLSGLVSRTLAQEAKPPEHHEWDYGKAHGPAHWGDLKPEFQTCKVGQHQSPVDIEKTEKSELPAIQFDYKASPLRIVDNGHTVMITAAAGSSIRVGEAQYELKQFHFHRPSETRVHGKSYDMELHLVHADAAGRLAVVGVLMERGAENALVRELWRNIPKQKEHEAVVEAVSVDPTALLPKDRGYYTFAGSLTTPPCSEDVTWIVLKQPLAVSADQVAQFSRLYQLDARPPQPLHGRVVRETK